MNSRFALLYPLLLALTLTACSEPLTNTEAAHEEAEHSDHSDADGHTRIARAVAAELDIQTEVAGAQTLQQTLPVYGRVLADSERLSHVSARFDGRISEVYASLGERVIAGTRLASIESNQSLTTYAITAPIGGIILQRDAGPGEQSAGRELFTIMDDSQVWVDLAIFPQDLAKVSAAASVTITSAQHPRQFRGSIARFLPQVQDNQARTARVQLANPDGALIPGSWVQAHIAVAQFEVPLAVRREAVQSFHNANVIYVQEGEDYEVRPLVLGRQSEQWVEVLSGLAPGTRYVSKNSYIIKADIEKAGATHDH